MQQIIKSQIKTEDNIQFETFALQDNISLTAEEEQNYKELCDKLGLEGQKNFIQECEGSVIPFIALSNEEKNIWKLYCPHEVEIKKYADSIIPPQVLEIVSTCFNKEYFENIFVWSETKDDIDPVVVGIKNNNTFLLCRWGHSLRPYEEIKKIAVENFKAKIIRELQSAKREVEGYLNSVESEVEKRLSQGNLGTPSFYWW